MSLYRCAKCGSSSVVMNNEKGAPGFEKEEKKLLDQIKLMAGNFGNKKAKTYFHCAACGQTLTYCMSDYVRQEVDLAIRTNNFFSIKKLKEQYPNMDYEVPIQRGDLS